MGVTFEKVRAVAHALPGVEDGTSYGTPALKVKGKLLARMKEDGETLVLHLEPSDRDFLLSADPAVFFTTDHYAGYPYLLIRLRALPPRDLPKLLRSAWLSVAPPKLLAQLEVPVTATPQSRRRTRTRSKLR